MDLLSAFGFLLCVNFASWLQSRSTGFASCGDGHAYRRSLHIDIECIQLRNICIHVYTGIIFLYQHIYINISASISIFMLLKNHRHVSMYI